MIHEEKFKNLNAVVLENDLLKVIVIPELGGKIASIYKKGKNFELLFQNKENVYKIPKLNSSFEQFDAAGFDDAFPTIDACKVLYEGKEILYPDHGEIWSGQFHHTIEGSNLNLIFKSSILPYEYHKTMCLEGNELIIHYTIKNTGNSPIPCIWAMHCLINCEEGMTINFPEGTNKVLNVHTSSNLGEVGQIHNYPITKNLAGNDYYLNKIGSKSLNNTEKYYAYNYIEEGVCSAYYPSKDVNYQIKFDKDALPYVGFWVTEGGFRGDYNCALEPTNGFYDSIDIAKEHDKLFYLEKNKAMDFKISIALW